MAEPISTTALVAKAALTAARNPNIRKCLGWIIVGILSPIIVVVAVICGMLSGTANHNNNVLDLCFYGGVIGDVPQEYRLHIESMQDIFSLIDTAILTVNAQIEDGNSLDTTRVKAIFYSLFFGQRDVASISTNKFVRAFYTTEERTRIVTITDENGEDTTYEESYTIAIPVENMATVYQNIASTMGKIATQEGMANASEIYYRVKYGVPAPTYGNEFDDFINGHTHLHSKNNHKTAVKVINQHFYGWRMDLFLMQMSIATSDVPFVGVDGFVEPVASWENSVTSEFGNRIHPITGKKSFHGGIDLGKAEGTTVHAVLDGTVMLVRYATTGYGYHVLVDHGGNFVTLYAHNSKLLVAEGQEVTAGQPIAEVGTTGNSTGNHLHFEIRKDGEKQNPRSYLP